MREKDGKKDAYTLSLVLILLVLGIIMAGYLHYSHYARNYQEQAEAQLAAVAELKVAELVQYRSERLGDAMILYQNPTFVSLVRHFFQSQDDPKARTLLHGWMNHLQHVYRYDRIMLFDADGVERLSLPDTKAIISPQISRAGSEVIQSGRIVLEDFYRNEYTQRIHLSLLIPVLDQAGRPPLGLLVMRIDPEKQLYPIINRWPTLSRTAETLLIRREGDAAVLLNNLRVEPRKALSWRISLDHKDVVAVRAVLGEEGIIEGRGFQGRPVIAALRTVPDSPWALVARIDKAEVYAPLRERMWETAGIVMALLISAAAGIGFLWRQRRIDFYRHRYESAELLRQNESRLRRAEEIGRAGNWRLDLRTGTVSWSDGVYRIFGIDPNTFQPSTENVLQLIHPDDRAEYEHILNHFEEHDHHTFSFHIVRPDGQIRSVAGKAETIRSESGDPTAFFATLADTTELTQKERELQEKQAELERFTYTISHDLRSPLVTVKTFLGYLEQDLIQGDTSRISQDFEYMRTATDKMERLLEELLALSRIGRIVNAPATFTFTDLVDETLQLLAGSIAEHGVEIKIANNSGVSFYADRQRLLEIWQNLIENAIKFSSGRIPPRITVGSTLIDGQWVFSVCDNGIGIDPRYHKKIFGLFEKLDPEGDGTGIGLAVVKRIVELYQGTIWLEASETGDGTCFRFTLPAAISYEKLRDVS